MKRKLLMLLLGGICLGWQSELDKKSFSKNSMTVNWSFENDRIYIEMTAPTDGWVTIGFNASSKIEGNYLLMGHIVDGKPNVIEHYTISAGNYKPITSLGAKTSVEDIGGLEIDHKTKIKFSIPTEPTNKFQKKLTEGTVITLLMAYSREDDFQHHSMMRTSAKITL